MLDYIDVLGNIKLVDENFGEVIVGIKNYFFGFLKYD